MNLLQLPPRYFIGHRGFPAKFPENTLVGFEAASECGILMIELDVGLSRDRKLVVMHDDDLDRTTDGKGPLKDRLWSEIQTLDAGSWFSPEFKGIRVPSLEEVLMSLGDRLLFNIEIKPSAMDKIQQDDSIEIQVIELVKRFGLTHKAVLTSFETEIMRRIAKMKDAPALGVLTSGKRFDAELSDLMNQIRSKSWHCDRQSLTPDQVQRADKHGFDVRCYTVDNQKDADLLFKMGVKGVFTDDATLLLPPL